MPNDTRTTRATRTRKGDRIEQQAELDRKKLAKLEKKKQAADGAANEKGQEDLNLTFPQRLKHFTWAWFTLNMATGGLALTVGQYPIKFRGQNEIGVAIFVFNLVLFFINNILILTRFIKFRHTLRNSFIHPSESLLVPTYIVSIGVILSGCALFGIEKSGPWLVVFTRVCFWVYASMAILGSCLSYISMWSLVYRSRSGVLPAWIFPVYPCLLMGPIAAVIAPYQQYPHNIRILVGGVAIQGIGYVFALSIYAAYLSRLMTDKLPSADSRPSMFIAVGPSAFTCIGLIGMGKAAFTTNAFGETFAGVDGKLAQDIARIVSIWMGIFLWGAALYFALIAIAAHILAIYNRKLHFRMNMYSIIFPNTALTIATYRVGEVVDSPAIEIFGAVMGCVLVLLYIWIFGKMLLAIRRRDILWPNKDEDKSEGNFDAEGVQSYLIPVERRNGIEEEDV